MTMDTLSSSRSSIVYLWHSHVDPGRHMYLHLILIGVVILSITIMNVLYQLKIELMMKIECNKQNVCVRMGHHDLHPIHTLNIDSKRIFCHTNERKNVTVHGILVIIISYYGCCILVHKGTHLRFGCTKVCISYGDTLIIGLIYSIQMVFTSHVSYFMLSECILYIIINLIRLMYYIIVRLRSVSSDGRLINRDDFESLHKHKNHRTLYELLTYTFKWTFSFNDLLFCCLVMCVSYCVNPSSVDADNFIFIDYDLILILFYNRWIKYHCLAISFYTQPLTSPRIGSIKPCIYYTVLERLDQPTQMPTDKCDFGNPPKETHLCENTLIKNLNAYKTIVEFLLILFVLVNCRTVTPWQFIIYYKLPVHLRKPTVIMENNNNKHRRRRQKNNNSNNENPAEKKQRHDDKKTEICTKTIRQTQRPRLSKYKSTSTETTSHNEEIEAFMMKETAGDSPVQTQKSRTSIAPDESDWKKEEKSQFERMQYRFENESRHEKMNAQWMDNGYLHRTGGYYLSMNRKGLEISRVLLKMIKSKETKMAERDKENFIVPMKITIYNLDVKKEHDAYIRIQMANIDGKYKGMNTLINSSDGYLEWSNNIWTYYVTDTTNGVYPTVIEERWTLPFNTTAVTNDLLICVWHTNRFNNCVLYKKEKWNRLCNCNVFILLNLIDRCPLLKKKKKK
eukprot:883096_1